MLGTNTVNSFYSQDIFFMIARVVDLRDANKFPCKTKRKTCLKKGRQTTAACATR